jgi:hypothetical protein
MKRENTFSILDSRFSIVAALCVLMSGCSIFPPKVKLPGVGSVSAFKDAGTPATMAEGTDRTGMRIPANSKVTVEKREALPSTGFVAPAATFYTFELPEPTDFMSEVRRIQASTGTVDTSLASKRIDAEERRPLLYCAIAAVVAGLGFMYVRFQAIAVMSFMAAGAFFIAWRMAEISGWVGGLFLVAAVAGFAFYKRAEWDKNGDGVPDFLQTKPGGEAVKQ